MGANSERLSASLQENLLVLLTFNQTHAATIRNTVDAALFGSQIYREVVSRIYDYIDQYHKPPGDHLPDLLEDELAKDKPSASLYIELLTAIHDQQGKVNEQYILNQLQSFVRLQTLKGSIIRASEAMQDGDLELADEELHKGLRTRLAAFSPGIGLTEGLRAAYAGEVRTDVIPTGIAQLDEAQLGCGRGELHLFIAAPKKGKSMWLIHMAKRCLLHRMRVVYVTLELSEKQIAQRMVQSLFSVARHKAKVPVSRLRTDDLGRFLRFESDTITGRPSLSDTSTRPTIERKLARLYGRENIIIKQFPAGHLTMRGLENYLDMLEQNSSFIPDCVIVDYPKYMQIDPKNYRLEASALYDRLRGLAVSRNVAVITSSESNREGAKARLITNEHAGEDYSRIYTADTIFTYSQTTFEKELGLARLFVTSTRVALRDGFIVLLSQAYPLCQFALDSVSMPGDVQYRGHLEEAEARKNGNAKQEDEE